MALAPSPDQRWFQSRLGRPNANLTVLAGTDLANRIVAVFETAEEAKEAVDAHNARLNANGPAETGISPSRGSNNPSQENAVNKQQHTRTPVFPPAIDNSHAEPTEVARICGELSPASRVELRACMDGLRASEQGFAGGEAAR